MIPLRPPAALDALLRDAPVAAGASVVLDAGGAPARAQTLDQLARLALVARRHGARLTLGNASTELLALLELAGLAEAVGARAP